MSVESGGSNSVTVNPGATVNYSVVAELSDLLNEGLAGFAFDLSFDGGALPQADAPVAGNMLSFTTPEGLSNPDGFGGTLSGGALIQIGGAQNTFKNVFTLELSGGVQPGVASFGLPEVLVTGSLTAPVTPGTYTLSLQNLAANVIRQGEDGTGDFWAVDEANQGTVDQLVIEVAAPLTVDTGTISVAAGGSQNWSLDAGIANAGRGYWMLGSLTGTSPGFPIGSVVVPVNPDVYFNLTFTKPNIAPLVNSLSFLNGAGQGAGAFSLPPGSNPALVGLTVHHAYMLGPVVDFASNPVSLTFLP